MITLLRDKSVSDMVLRAIHAGRMHRNPNAVAQSNTMLNGAFVHGCPTPSAANHQRYEALAPTPSPHAAFGVVRRTRISPEQASVINQAHASSFPHPIDTPDNVVDLFARQTPEQIHEEAVHPVTRGMVLRRPSMARPALLQPGSARLRRSAPLQLVAECAQ